MKVSIIIPVLNEVSTVCSLLSDLQPLRHHGHELIVVDGGSTDGTVAAVSGLVDGIYHARAGRARQMNAGAERASGDIFWFLHADTKLTTAPAEYIQSMCKDTLSGWGRFDVVLSGHNPAFRLIEYLMNWRSRLTGIATGDQGIYVGKSLFHSINGFDNVPIMEDIRLCSNLKKLHKPCCHRLRLMTSSRRWEHNGIMKTVSLMWYLRFAHLIGVKPERLVKKYYQ